jgi:hypothetical protein
MTAPHVTGPAAGHADKLMLLGRFAGSWRLEWAGTDTGGLPATMTGEPPLAVHGSAFRFCGPAIDAWRSTWIEPVNGRGTTLHRPARRPRNCAPQQGG